MLPLIAAVLLAASPRPSLLAPDSGRHLSARLLVAQEPPPDTLTPPPLLPGVEAEREARIRELTRKVGLLQDEIRSINVNWPAGPLAMAIAGYALSPLLLVGIPLLIYGLGSLAEGTDDGTILGVALGVTVAGSAGVGLLVGGIISGSRQAAVQRDRRDELVRQRIRLEDELRELKSRRDARGAMQARRWTPRPTVPLLAARF